MLKRYPKRTKRPYAASFRFSKETLDLLQFISECMNCSKAKALEECVEYIAKDFLSQARRGLRKNIKWVSKR